MRKTLRRFLHELLIPSACSPSPRLPLPQKNGGAVLRVITPDSEGPLGGMTQGVEPTPLDLNPEWVLQDVLLTFGYLLMNMDRV